MSERATGEPGHELAGFQRKYLRKLAHGRRAAVRVGAAGLSEAVQRAVDQALSDHELIVVKLHQPADKRAMARELAAHNHAELCGLVGHTVILYRRDPESPRIEVPERTG